MSAEASLSVALQAFGAVGSLEAAYWRETGKQMLLSEQELIDCAWDPKDDNKGCMGGFQTLAYKWLLPRGLIFHPNPTPLC